MGNDEDRFARRFHAWQQLKIEDVLKSRILIGGPFIEQTKGAVLQVRSNQRESFALAVR